MGFSAQVERKIFHGHENSLLKKSKDFQLFFWKIEFLQKTGKNSHGVFFMATHFFEAPLNVSEALGCLYAS